MKHYFTCQDCAAKIVIETDAKNLEKLVAKCFRCGSKHIERDES